MKNISKAKKNNQKYKEVKKVCWNKWKIVFCADAAAVALDFPEEPSLVTVHHEIETLLQLDKR